MAPRRACIILADQQVLFRQSLAQILISAGHAVIYQVGDSDALDRCMIDSDPDIVVLDRYLPGVDGLTYCKLRVSNRMEAGLVFLRHGKTLPTRRADE
jgi:DNA-binding NarL/FixJ family response regulator